MEAYIIKQKFTSGSSLKDVMNVFFKKHTPEDAKVLFWKFFQCWVTKDCNIKAEVSDEELALFLDQLNELIEAAYNVHLEDDVSSVSQKGDSHD